MSLPATEGREAPWIRLDFGCERWAPDDSKEARRQIEKELFKEVERTIANRIEYVKKHVVEIWTDDESE